MKQLVAVFISIFVCVAYLGLSSCISNPEITSQTSSSQSSTDIPLINNKDNSVKTEGFAICLTNEDVTPAQMQASTYYDAVEPPIIGMNDIITYNAQTYEIRLTQNAFERISQLDVPVSGKSFVVCVDGNFIYWRAFWTPASSISFNGVTIWKPYSPAEPYVIKLELGSPSSSFYGGEDPRNSPNVLDSFFQAGKLVTKLSITTIDKLPRAFKGYELYSWFENGQWRFTLITGTNRGKTLSEITNSDDFISEAGWVRIRVTGMDATETVLSKLPVGEQVFWRVWTQSEQTGQAVHITLPSGQLVDAVKEYAEGVGLFLRVQQP